jgi:hypothetical protein
MNQPDPGEPREPREQGGEMSQPSPGEPGEPRERGVRCAERGGQVSGAAWASSSCLTTWAPRRGRGVDFDGWLTWECDSRSRAEHVAFEAIDTCIVWLT